MRGDGITSITNAVRIEGNEHAFPCAPDQRLLVAMEAARATDILRRWMATIPVGCRRGGCGVCRVRIVDGEYETGAMSVAHVTEAERAQGYALACCVYPRGPLTVALAPRHANQIKAIQAATENKHENKQEASAMDARTGGNP